MLRLLERGRPLHEQDEDTSRTSDSVPAVVQQTARQAANGKYKKVSLGRSSWEKDAEDRPILTFFQPGKWRPRRFSSVRGKTQNKRCGNRLRRRSDQRGGRRDIASRQTSKSLLSRRKIKTLLALLLLSAERSPPSVRLAFAPAFALIQVSAHARKPSERGDCLGADP